jgi:hypothetical protein
MGVGPGPRRCGLRRRPISRSSVAFIRHSSRVPKTTGFGSTTVYYDYALCSPAYGEERRHRPTNGLVPQGPPDLLRCFGAGTPRVVGYCGSCGSSQATDTVKVRREFVQQLTDAVLLYKTDVTGNWALGPAADHVLGLVARLQYRGVTFDVGLVQTSPLNVRRIGGVTMAENHISTRPR